MPKLSDDVVRALVPEAEPAFRVPEGVPVEIATRRAQALESSVETRIFLWASTLQAQIESERWDSQLPGFLGATYGFIPVPEGAQLPDGLKTFGGYVFGVAIEIEPTHDDPAQEVESFIQDRIPIARVLNRRLLELHLPNPMMPRGTGGCWARSRKTKIRPAADGVLTAEHVVAGLPLGSPVVMSAPGTWHLGDRGSCKIDAALIVQAGCIPPSAAPLAVHISPLASRQVSFYGSATGGNVKARITHTVVHPRYYSDRHPMRVFLDSHGVSGDSGALVQDTSTAEGLGIYMGRDPIPPAAGAQPIYEGVAQFLAQVDTPCSSICLSERRLQDV